MGTQVTPDQTGEPQVERTDSSPSTPEVTTPVTPPTTPPADPPINPAYVRALEDTLRENNRRIQQQQDQLEEIRRTPPASTAAPVTMTPEEQRNAFFNNPHEHTRNIVADEMGKQIAPLLEFIKKVPNPSNDTLKQRMKYDPRYASHFASEPLLEQAFDAVVAATPNVTEQSAHAIMSQVIGWKVTGQLRAVLGLPDVPANTAPTTPTPPTVPNNPAPPYVPPTAPATPRQNAQPKLRELTENERRLARERGQSHEAYLAWIDERPENVVSSKIGRNG